MASTSVFIDLIGRDQASPAFQKAAASAETSATRMNTAFRSAIVTAGKLGLAFGAYELVKKAIDIGKEAAVFQRNMTLIQTQAGASAAEVRYFSNALLAMSGQVAQAPEDLATSLYHVYSVGLRGAKALNVVRIAAEGARVGNADLEETTNALTSSVASGIKGVQNMSQAMGALNAIVGAGDMKLSDLNDALGSGLLTVARTFNVSLTQVGAALAVFGDNNIRGAYAATLLRMSIQDLAKPAANADDTLSKVGLSSAKLAADLEKGGLTSALTDLKQHMTAAGVTAGKVGPFIVNAFTKRAGTGLAILIEQMGRYQNKLDAVAHGAHVFGNDWQATQKTTSFVFARLGDELKSFGIQAANRLLPPVTQFVAQIGVVLPGAVRTAQGILTPFAHFTGDVLGTAWHDLGTAVSLVGVALKPVVQLLSDLKTPLGFVATGALAAYAGFRLFSGIAGLFARGGMFDMIAVRMMYARDAVVGFGASAATTARSFVGSSATIAATADATAGDVAAAGTVAKVGWTGLLGPLGAVALGVGALVSMFHKSSAASAEATAAARAYTDAFTQGGDRPTILDAITKQLSDNNVPEKIAELNTQLRAVSATPIPSAKLADLAKQFGSATFAGKDFLKAVSAASQGNSGPLDQLRAKLQAVIDAGSPNTPARGPEQYLLDRNGVAVATALLDDLNAQYGALSKAQLKEIADAKAFGTTVTPIQNVAQATHLASDTASKYATMLGYQVTKNNDVIGSSRGVSAAVNEVRTAYANASQTASDFLDAIDKFSSSAGTAADRAALIGSTLKAANGDALSFAAAMSGSTSAISSVTDAFAQQRQELAQQTADQSKANSSVLTAQGSLQAAQQRVAAAQARVNELRRSATTSASTLKSAEASLTSAQNSAASAARSLSNAQATAGQAGALAYRDTERAAIRFRDTNGRLTASINTQAKGAYDLISQLQGIQTAAMGAASATFQHYKAQLGAKDAAEKAYQIYQTETRGSLIDNAKQLGLTTQQAHALAKEYFGMPGHVKTLIEAEGTNPILTVLKRIGQLLAHLTGQKWRVDVSENVTRKYNNNAAGATSLEEISRIPAASSGRGPRQYRAMGGPVYAGQAYVVGERRPELFVPDTNGRVVPNVPAPSKSVVIQHLEQKLTIMYPLPGDTREALPQLARASAQKIGELL